MPKTVWTGPKQFGPTTNIYGFVEGQGMGIKNQGTFVKYCLFRDIGILKLNIHHRFQEKSIANFKIQILQSLKIEMVDYLRIQSTLKSLIDEQVGIFRLLHEKLRSGWKENLKNLSKHAVLLGTSE